MAKAIEYGHVAEGGTATHHGADRAGRGRAAPRSHLLVLASAVSLVMALLLGAALATLGSAHVASSTIGASAAADRDLARALLEKLGAAAIAEPVTPADREQVARTLERAAADVGPLGIALVGAGGETWASAGSQDAAAHLPAGAAGDEPGATLVDGSQGPRLFEWFPVQLDGRPVAVLGIVRDGGTAVAAAAAAQRDIALAAGIGSSVLIVLVFVIFRGAQRRLDHQTRQLIETARRDQLTGHLTHGAVVSELTAAVGTGVESVAVALVDIDNFRQLNEVHGNELGDAVIRRVGSALGETAPAGTSIGRSGPDEFLVVSRGADAGSVAAWLEETGRQLAAGIDTSSGDRLPLTISSGVAVAPLHGRTATELLSAVAMTLGEAKSGGGDEVLISRLSYAELIEDHRATFSILDGLVNAIDARDRYTRRHSEDVARYALFLAREMGLDDALCGALHQASLLHDVGKIAVPDRILRKPGGLSGAEMEIVQQHVLLGSVLVRDLAAADLVVDGVRHHHERWDGGGYPDGLAGDAIPLVARLVAVADTYSAMTTTRPYRRALARGEALERLVAAAGSQLDPRLVDVFVLAMESRPGAPVPSDQRAPTVWLSAGAAA